MPWEKTVLYFVVSATLTSFFELGNGQEAGAVLQTTRQTNSDEFMRSGMLRTGDSLHRKSVMPGGKNESVATTRNGPLSFGFDNQADQRISTRPPAWHSVVDAKLKRLNPSVQCSNHSMTLKVKRNGAPSFLVDSGEGPPVPLSNMPSNCGFSVRRSRRDVLFVAPYQGCHVTQQEGNYVLPLRLWGTPVTMSCPIAPPPPSVCCFPTGMVLKIGGVMASGLKVKVSGMWESLSSVCDSCGFAVEVHPGGLTLTAPYHKGLCIEMKNDEYLLSLLLADGELLVTCPSRKDVQTPTATTAPAPSDSGQFLQYPQYPKFPMLPQYPVFPGPVPQTQSPAPITYTVVQKPQHPKFQRPLHPPSSATSTDSQEVPPAQHPEIPFMSQYPWLIQYPMFPGPIPPTQSPSANKNTPAPPGQFPQKPQSPQVPMAQGAHHAIPPPATTASTKDDVMPQRHQQPQFPSLPQHPFPPFPKFPMHPESHPQGSATAVHASKPVIQEPQQHMYPQLYQMPVVYPPPKYPFQTGNVHPLKPQTAAPATIPTTAAATAIWPPAQRQFYHPNPYMPAYYAPQQAPITAFPNLPISSGQSEPKNNHPNHHQQDSVAGGTQGSVDYPQEHHQVPFMPYDAHLRSGYSSWNMHRDASYPFHEKHDA